MQEGRVREGLRGCGCVGFGAAGSEGFVGNKHNSSGEPGWFRGFGRCCVWTGFAGLGFAVLGFGRGVKGGDSGSLQSLFQVQFCRASFM